MTIYDYALPLANGKELSLSEHKNDVMLFVNTASQCGFTPQYEGLENLHRKFKDQGLTVIGCICNQFGEQAPGTSDEEHSFCNLNFGVTFPLTAKLEVNGEQAHPLFKHLTSVTEFGGFGSNDTLQGIVETKFGVDFTDTHSVKWNFTKFLVDRQGNVTRFEPTTTPEEMESAIESALK